MLILLNVIIIIAAILLVGIVLIQKSKGGGLAADFSGANNMMGIRRTTDFLEKATWTLVGVVVVCSILSVGVSISNSKTGQDESSVTNAIEQQANPNPTGAGFGEEVPAE